jgi:hypothetical protein
MIKIILTLSAAFFMTKELDQVDKQEVKKGGKKSKPPQIDTNIITSGIQLKNNIFSNTRQNEIELV